MKIVVWIVQILVAIAFFGSGMMKLITPYSDLTADPNMGWATDFSATTVKIIAILEILGALGLILPMIIKKYRFLVPLSAMGLALTMVGAAITHISRGEPFVINIVLFTMAALVAWWRRGYLTNRVGSATVEA